MQASGFRYWTKRIKPWILDLLLTAGLLAGSAYSATGAEDESTGTKAMTEKELISRALEYSRKLQFLNTNVEIEQYRLQSAGWIENPELRLSRRIDRYNDVDEYDEWRIGLRWDVPRLGEMREDRQNARVDLWDRKVDEIRYRQKLVNNVRRDFANVLRHDRLTELAERRVKVEDKRIRIIEQMVNLGNRSIVYYTKAKMWHAESKNDYARAVESRTQARRRLAKRTGIDPETRLIETDLPEVTLDLDTLIQIAYLNRPELKLVTEKTKLALRQNRYEQLKLMPWFNFVEMTHHRDVHKHYDWRQFKVGIELPVFNWNLGNIKATNLAVKKKEAQSDAVRETIEQEVRTAYNIYQDLLLEWKNFRRDAKVLISEAQNVVDEAREHKALMSDEVLEMEITIIDTEEMLAEKRQNLAYALVDLYYEIGVESHEQLNR